jgi:hypothetical protein
MKKARLPCLVFGAGEFLFFKFLFFYKRNYLWYIERPGMLCMPGRFAYKADQWKKRK